MPKALYANLKKCIACRACEVACEREHNGTANVQVTMIENSGAVPVACRHCGDSPCAKVCPSKAISRSPEEIILLNASKCNGCGMCIFACPCGAIYLKNGVIAKCDLCMHRLARASAPACASTCPTGAIFYGETDDFADKNRLRRALVLGQES
jgi:formate dehydrogenase iron-sulfur subunit